MAKLDNAAVIREVYRAFDGKNRERALQCTTATAKMTNVPLGVSINFAEYFQNWASAFPDAKVEVVNLVSTGDNVIAECIGRGTHNGVFQAPTGPIQPTHRKLELRFVESFDLTDGKISSGRIYFDLMGFLRQLGVGERAGARVETHAPAH